MGVMFVASLQLPGTTDLACQPGYMPRHAAPARPLRRMLTALISLGLLLLRL